MRKRLLIVLAVVGILALSTLLPSDDDPTVPEPRTSAMTQTQDVL